MPGFPGYDPDSSGAIPSEIRVWLCQCIATHLPPLWAERRCPIQRAGPYWNDISCFGNMQFLGNGGLRGPLTKKISWTYKAQANFKRRIKELTGRSWGVSMGYRLRKLGQYLRGWTAYFGISQYYRPVPELDEWIRRRIRMCYWKQWRWVRTKIKHLLALGVSLKTAIQHGVSSKSYWHMARTPAVQQALSNAWLKAQGLFSVKDLWCKAQGYTAKKGKASSSVPTC